QRADGSWRTVDLAPWPAIGEPPEPAPDAGDGYATAIVVLGLVHGGGAHGDPRLERAVAWLRAAQDPATGARSHPGKVNRRSCLTDLGPGLMGDASTAFAVLALEAHREAGRRVPGGAPAGR